MHTKAVQIELVLDLSTTNFLLSLKKITARKGVLAKIFSDNATNFKGVHTNMRKLFEFFKDGSNNQISDYLVSRFCMGIYYPQIAPTGADYAQWGIKRYFACSRKQTDFNLVAKMR